MENLELVIFDMDGLMFDSEIIAFKTWKEVVENNNYPFTHEFFLTMLGSNLERIKSLCFKQYGDDFPFDKIKAERYALTREIITKEGVPHKNGLIELLEFLKTLPIKIALATSSNKERAHIFLKNTDVEKYFDTFVFGDEIKHSKPEPDIFLTAAKKLNCDPKKTIVLEDSFAGITAAYKGGMIPIMVPDFKLPTEEILSMTHQCFTSLLDVKEYLKGYKF